MKPLMFRFKIAALSLLISGLLVLGFAVFFLFVIGQVGMDRVDQEIKALGETQLRGKHPRDHWADFDRSLAFIYGDDRADRIAVRVCDINNEVLFESEHWPQALTESTQPTLAYEPPPVEDHMPPRVPPGARAHEGQPPDTVKRFIVRFDGDGDGKVSPREFDGPEDHFHKLDQDADGYISAAEAPLGPPPHEMPDDDRPHRRDNLASAPAHAVGHRTEKPLPARPKIPVLESISASGHDWRVAFMGNQFVSLTVAADLSELHEEAAFFRKVLFAITPLALLGLAAAGWFLASRALRPVAIITRTVEAITARGLNQRVPRTAADAELERLERVINSMLDRLERSFNQAARFSADAAHELQTPLTVLQGELDNAVQEAVAGSEEQQRYGLLLEEVSGLKAVVQKLLLLARADVGQMSINPEHVDLSGLALSAIEDMETMAPHLAVESDIPAEIHVKGDAALLGQVVRNMTTNAMKYSTADGRVRLGLAARAGVATFTLANTAPPIQEEDREKIFTRFFRVDKARSRSVGGTGLGLSLAREIARAHGGDLLLDPCRDGWVSFTLTLPCS